MARTQTRKSVPGRRIRSGLRRHGLMRRPPEIRRLVRAQNLRFTDGNRVDLFDNGHEGLSAMLAAIETASHYVHLETYIFRSDATGRRFLDALTRGARRGASVRLIYDALGSRGLDDGALEPLRAAGADLVAFNPIYRLRPRFAPRRRDHRKILVVDGEVAFTGGLNIGDEYQQGLERGTGWRDAHLEIRGPAVRELEAVFLESWFRADGPDLPWQAFLGAPAIERGDVRCGVLADGPVYRRRRMRDLLVSALENAAIDVKLGTPYFAPGRRLIEALSAASQRGVAVDLMLAGRTDHPILRRAARTILPRLLDCGVRVHEYGRSMMHAKVGVFDGQWAIIGSSNLDRQSFQHSYEVNVIIEGGEIPMRLRQRFELDVADSRPVDDSSLGARSALERLLDRLASLLVRLL